MERLCFRCYSVVEVSHTFLLIFCASYLIWVNSLNPNDPPTTRSFRKYYTNIKHKQKYEHQSSSLCKVFSKLLILQRQKLDRLTVVNIVKKTCKSVNILHIEKLRYHQFQQWKRKNTIFAKIWNLERNFLRLFLNYFRH